MRRGYSDTWFKLCKVSGVGEYAPGRLFSVAGLVNSSIVKDVEREIKAGKAPTVPITQGTIYLPFISERKDKTQTVGTNLSEIAEESSAASSANGSQLAEISANDRVVKPVRTIKAMASQKLKENIPPTSTNADKQEQAERPTRPATALRRARSNKGRPDEFRKVEPTITMPKRSQRVPSHSKPVQSLPSPAETEDEVENLVKAKALRPNARSRTTSQEDNPNVGIHTQPAKSMRSRTASKEDSNGVESLAKPIRSTARSRVTSREEHPQAEVPPVKAPSSLLNERPIRPNASRTATYNRSNDNAAQPRADRKDKEQTRSEAQQPIVQESLPTSPVVDVQGLRNTDPSTVLAMATKLRSNLLSALTNKTSSIKGKEKTQTLPFVTKWVDYAKKHGIGYILSDGTVGCVFNATASQSVRHVLVRDGSFHLSKASGDKTVNMNEIPLEFYSVGSLDAIKPMAMETELRRQNGLLWAKFARYMCSSLSGTSERSTENEDETDIVMVRYYQRLGNVGVWGFSNGCFQVSSNPSNTMQS
jgi:myosin I